VTSGVGNANESSVLPNERTLVENTPSKLEHPGTGVESVQLRGEVVVEFHRDTVLVVRLNEDVVFVNREDVLDGSGGLGLVTGAVAVDGRAELGLADGLVLRLTPEVDEESDGKLVGLLIEDGDCNDELGVTDESEELDGVALVVIDGTPVDDIRLDGVALTMVEGLAEVLPSGLEGAVT
jgi:hypothetical protein